MFSSYPRIRTFRQSIGVTSCALLVWASVVTTTPRDIQNSSPSSISARELLAVTVAILWNSWGAPELLG